MCAALGADVAILCLTRGEHGPKGDRLPADASRAMLAAVRAGELRDACEALGVKTAMLLDHEDGMLPWLDAARLEGDIAAVIDRHRPEVVVTFDEDGLYWHPDHIAVHERTTAVVERLGARGPALFYASLPAGMMKEIASHAALRLQASGSGIPQGTGPDAGSPPILGISNAEAFGSAAPAPTLVLDAGVHAVRKLHALQRHATQMAGGALALIDNADAPRLLGREQFRRADVGRPGPTFLDALAGAEHSVNPPNLSNASNPSNP